MNFFQKFFSDFFDVPRITPTRIADFADDAIERITANDPLNQFGEIVSQVREANLALRAELVELSGGKGTQKGHTLLTDAVVEDFRKAMRELEPEISYRLKGPKSIAYLELYPGGKTEYNRATKANMSTLTERVKQMVAKYAAELGTEVINRLKIFAQDWEGKRDHQRQHEGAMDTDRTERSATRREVEKLLVKLLHTVGAAFPADTEKCNSFFNFSLLDAHKHSSLDRP